MMRNAATLTLTVASAFLAVVALLVNAPALFYMGLALIVLILTAKFQAWLAVGGLKWTRLAPREVMVGEEFSVQLSVESERKISRPLLLVQDELPRRMRAEIVSWAAPIAPSYRRPINVSYRVRAHRRGVFRWTDLLVSGSDALGLATSVRQQPAGEVIVRVLPVPLPFEVDLVSSAALGTEEVTEAAPGTATLDVRGVREFVPGDAMRHIHWRSTARTGTLMVREFESPAASEANVWVQDTPGTDLRGGLDPLCGYAAHYLDVLLKFGPRARLQGEMIHGAPGNPLRPFQLRLAELMPDAREPFGQRVARRGGAAAIFIAMPDPEIPAALHGVRGVTAYLLPSAYWDERFRRALIQAGVKVALLPDPSGRTLEPV